MKTFFQRVQLTSIEIQMKRKTCLNKLEFNFNYFTEKKLNLQRKVQNSKKAVLFYAHLLRVCFVDFGEIFRMRGMIVCSKTRGNCLK